MTEHCNPIELKLCVLFTILLKPEIGVFVKYKLYSKYQFIKNLKSLPMIDNTTDTGSIIINILDKLALQFNFRILPIFLLIFYGIYLLISILLIIKRLTMIAYKPVITSDNNSRISAIYS